MQSFWPLLSITDEGHDIVVLNPGPRWASLLAAPREEWTWRSEKCQFLATQAHEHLLWFPLNNTPMRDTIGYSCFEPHPTLDPSPHWVLEFPIGRVVRLNCQTTSGPPDLIKWLLVSRIGHCDASWSLYNYSLSKQGYPNFYVEQYG